MSRDSEALDKESGSGGGAQVSDYVDADIGARAPVGWSLKVVVWIAVLWSLFQIWVASPLPYALAQAVPAIDVLNSTEIRSIHLAFAVALAFLLYPAFSRSPKHYIPLLDWALVVVAAFSSAYLYLNYELLAFRAGTPNTLDILVSVVGVLTLLEATRRVLGPPLAVIAIIFLVYIFFGQYAPAMLAWAGASLNRVSSHMWLTTEGVFGVALGVSARFVFLFVLFGALLDRAGAGNYFIKVAFALLGHLRGGPAKAAVLASGLTGLISGSSIANVVTTGTFTIPLMKRVGYPGYKAGAIESAAGINGQIMPPVMGAAAFLMVEFVGISYLQVIKHAFLPAIVTYIALFYIVHLEAVKADMKVLPRRGSLPSLPVRVLRFGFVTSSILIIAGASYYTVMGLRALFGGASFWLGAFLLGVVYVLLLAYSARFPDLEQDEHSAPITELPAIGPTAKSGLYYILPIFVLVWSLMVDRLSAGLSAFYSVIFLVVILLTQRPLLAFFRKQHQIRGAFGAGVNDCYEALFWGARNMVGVAVACATAGIIVGTVTLTGVGQVLAQFIDLVSGGSLIGVLLFVALVSLILGMGLPTTANYIVVSSLMAPVVVELGSQHGLAVPLIAVHMFVFYFGLMADVTPPVGLAAYAAAAIARSDPIRTGIQAFWYEIRTGLLPFMFIFNTKILLLGIDGPLDLVLTVCGTLLGMLLFCSATQRWLVVQNTWWESLAMLLLAFTFFRPGFWLDQVMPEYNAVPFEQASQMIPTLEKGAVLRLHVQGVSIEGKDENKTIQLPINSTRGDSTSQRLQDAGLQVAEKGGEWLVQQVRFGSPAQRSGIGYGYSITSIQVENERPSAYWFYLPALLILLLIGLGQRRRRAIGASG